MLRGLPRFVILALCLSSLNVFAHEAKEDVCERYLTGTQPITLKSLRELALQRIAAVEAAVPKPGFDNIEVEAHTEQIADTQVPLALQEMLGNGVGYVSTPAPTSTDPITIGLTVETYSIPLHVDTNWAGRRASTTAYVSLPKNKMKTAGGYVIGNDYPIAVVHLHGGGTPTATGKNAMSIGEKLATQGIPTLALDMPGHGRATKNPEGLMSMEAQIDWLLQQIDTLVHPNVKIVLSGHSWGGMFAAYMHRHSNEPKYKRIARFISLSPGVDVSLSGDNKKKLEWDAWWEKNFPQYADKIADADYDFQENMLANGKDSDVGGYFTSFTDFDYATPPLTPEQQKNLKPITVVVGSADGVVYVGREKQFEAAFGSLVEPSQFIVLGPGRNWKSKGPEDLQPTGHNIFDRYIDGTETLQVYAMMADLVLAEVGGKINTAPEMDPVAVQFDGLFRSYAKYLGVREMIATHVEFVDVNTKDLPALSSRKVELDEYKRRVDQQLAENSKEFEIKMAKAVEKLRADIGLKDAAAFKRAQEEVSAPEMTPEREAELRDYIARVQELDDSMRASYADPHYDRELEALSKEFAPVMKQLGFTKIEDYRQHFDPSVKTNKTSDPAVAKLRSDLSRLHQKISDLNRSRQSRFGLERDRRLSQLKSPVGVVDLRTAQRELNTDRDTDRLAKLREFVARYPEVEAATRLIVDREANQKLEALAKPAGIGQWEEGLRAKIRQDAIMNMTYAPDVPVIQTLARRIAELTEERDRVVRGAEGQQSLDRLATEVEKLRTKRHSLLKKWEGMWKSGLITSPNYAQDKAEFDRTLDAYKELHVAYQVKALWLKELRETGATASVVVAGTTQLKSLRHKVQNARSLFISTRDKLEDVKWKEMLAGNVVATPDSKDSVLGAKLAAEAAKIATEVWGEDYPTAGRPSASSLTAQLRVQEDYLEGRRREASLLDRQRDELRYQYVREMTARGIPVPYTIERVRLFPLLNRPLRDLLPMLRENPTLFKALEQARGTWDRLETELRRGAQVKGDSGY